MAARSASQKNFALKTTMQVLTRGQKVKLSMLTPTSSLVVGMNATAANVSFDFSCFGLNADGQLVDDRYFIFYNQKASPDNALRILDGRDRDAQVFAVNLAQLPTTIRKLAFVVSIDGAGVMSQINRGYWRLLVSSNEVAGFSFTGCDFTTEQAIVAAEIYFKDVWRVAAVGQGFSGGLSAVLKHFGGQETEVSSNVVATPQPATPQPPARPTPIPPTRPAPPARAESQAGCCVRCGKNIGFFERLTSPISPDGRCKNCEVEIKVALDKFRLDFIAASSDGLISDDEWNQMWARFDTARQGVSHEQVLRHISSESLQFMERLVTMAASDGIITEAEERYIQRMAQVLDIPTQHIASIQTRLAHLKAAARIREGHLPLVAHGLHHLDAGEVCHLETPATFHKVLSRSVTDIRGNIVATSKKLHFLSPTGGWTIQYKNIMRIEDNVSSVYLELSTRTGNGRYTVNDPLIVGATITALTRMAKRQLLSPRDDNESRHIPQDVKTAVWQRDGGRCAQCKADTYLEFDHIIPHSKGGANTVNNIQLLCRKCNLDKGARI
jgi:stress response protein SCP2/uncharacterized tellurite resistance protein B-like protein